MCRMQETVCQLSKASGCLRLPASAFAKSEAGHHEVDLAETTLPLDNARITIAGV